MDHSFKKITEFDSTYRHIEKMSVKQILECINQEDRSVAFSVAKAMPAIEKLIMAVADKLMSGGRMFYIGAGTSGRLGIVDASECPPSFGVPASLVIGIIAGGKNALVSAVEGAEDDREKGWIDLCEYQVNEKDIVIGISASGHTSYVMAALKKCRENNIETGAICNNEGAPLSSIVDHIVEVVTGPEFITGSTRMKSGTAQKLILNMISTTVMIQLGRIEDNKMVNMQLTNEKLIDRGVKMLMQKAGLDNYELAKTMLLEKGSVKKALESYHS